MPRYELALILKAMQRPETAAVLKRTVEALMERGAIVRNLENLGERSLPYKISRHNERHRRGGNATVCPSDLPLPWGVFGAGGGEVTPEVQPSTKPFLNHLPRGDSWFCSLFCGPLHSPWSGSGDSCQLRQTDRKGIF
ncbi:28S ribosomal protein S6, mitochondrial isoform X1 [Falco rusticolus]|uniref:28S ribosomal protein S6, mitochondrial isoform X1 n=1 Tax=Falco rusticolus TaxID=120794 RepID=UPI001886A696|nr:28S ribosomal protein S6, mitochondrial isoform X1 [Falco rusticolus]